ncbi:MAG TPA: hypothetical protein VIM11_04175 [Tepidisphaeraceae bacterium]
METQTLGTHQSTYDAIFRHPIARNLQWRDVRSMLGALAEVAEEDGGKVKFVRNGVTLAFHRPRGKDLSDAQEVMQIRHFLERSGPAPKAALAEGVHLLVVINHREARIFRTELHGAVPQRITPFDPYGTGRYLHQVEEGANGQRKPEPASYYEAIAKTLAGAQKILLLGSSTGSSSAMEHLVAELKAHHPELAARVAGTVVVNEQHMSDDQLLAEARAFYAAGDAKAGSATTSKET